MASTFDEEDVSDDNPTDLLGRQPLNHDHDQQLPLPLHQLALCINWPFSIAIR
jgi:hypothetical protein